MSVARRIALNPADKSKRYILYSNGYIQAIGGALPVTQGDASINSWTPSSGAPVSSTSDGFMSFQIYDWNVPSGYSLDMYGLIYRWGNAPAIAAAPANSPLTGGPEYLFGTGGGFPSPTYGYVIDFMMDPSGGGTGYILLYNGEVIALGTGATQVQRYVIPDTASRMMQMDWASKRYWVLDNWGRVIGLNGGSHPAVVDTNGVSATYPAYIWGRGGQIAQGGFRLYNKAASPLGWEVDAFGRMYRIGAALDPNGYQFTQEAKQWVDMDIVDDGTGANPLRLVALTAQGRQFEYVVSTPPAAAVTEPAGTLTTANKPWIGWAYFDKEGDGQAAWEAKIISAAVYSAGTTNEVQSLNQTGGPTGGSVVLGFQRDSASPVARSGGIANNASAATVATALNAMPNIGAGGVATAGGPWGTAPITVTFQNQMAGMDWPAITVVQNSFTGGASPTIAISTTTNGVPINPTVAASVFSASGTDNSTRVRDTTELANSTSYRAYVRVTDTSGKQSAWGFSQFATAYTALSVPTIVVADQGGLAGVGITVTAATGTGLPGTSRFAVQFSDDAGATWYNVRNGDALVPSGGGVASVSDTEAPFGVARTYRAVTYVYDPTADSWQQSAWSTSVAGTLSPRNMWALTCPTSPSLAMIPKVQPDFRLTRSTVGQTFVAVNRVDPLVLTDATPRLPSFDLKLWALSAAERAKVEGLANSGLVLQVRDPLGRSWYAKVAGDFQDDIVRADPLPSELSSIRDAHDMTISLQAVRRPKAGPLVGPLVEA